MSQCQRDFGANEEPITIQSRQLKRRKNEKMANNAMEFAKVMLILHKAIKGFDNSNDSLTFSFNQNNKSKSEPISLREIYLVTSLKITNIFQGVVNSNPGHI